MLPRLPRWSIACPERLFLAAMLLPLPSCTPADPVPPGYAERIRLEGTGTKDPMRVVRRLQVPERVAPWEVRTAGKVEVVEHGGQPVLRLSSRESAELLLPAESVAGSFNRVIVRGMFTQRVGLDVHARTRDSRISSEPRYSFASTAREQTIELILPEVASSPGLLILRMLGGFGVLQLHSIELVDRPLATLLPGPEEDGAPVLVGAIARSGFGVVGEAGARGSFLVPGPGEELRLYYGSPSVPGVGTDEGALILRLLDGPTQLFSRELPCEGPGWSDLRLPLDGFAGRRLELELSAAGGPVVVSHPHRHLPEPAPRTVVLVTSDTHRGDHVGYAGGVLALATPHLDALAARGVAFTNAHATTNITSPSHVTLMTGRHPRDHGLVSNTMKMSASARTLAEAYRDAGWQTAAVVSVRHLGPEGTGLGQGFDAMVRPPGMPWAAEAAVDHALDRIDEAKGRSLFLWLHLFDAHAPYAPPEPFAGRYYPEDRDPFDDSTLGSPIENLPPQLEGLTDLEFPKSQYRAEIDYLDSQLGRLLAHPRVADALVAFTSDHGEILEKDGSYFHHGELFPDTLHVPLIVAWPEGRRGRNERAVTNLDLGRTLLDLSDLAHVRFPGRNLLVDGHAEEAPGQARFALSGDALSASITEGDWFFLLHLRPHKGALRVHREACTAELYHLAEDPDCRLDRIQTDPDRAGMMCRKLRDWLRDPRGERLARSDGGRTEAELFQLQALGYATDGPGSLEGGWIEEGCEPCKDLITRSGFPRAASFPKPNPAQDPAAGRAAGLVVDEE